MTPAVKHYYLQFRGNMEYTAEQALAAARRHVAFRKRLARMVADNKRRSRAARKGWKTRRAS